MTVNSSAPLSLDSPEQESERLREENAGLRRLLEIHGIPIPQPALRCRPQQSQTPSLGSTERNGFARE